MKLNSSHYNANVQYTSVTRILRDLIVLMTPVYIVVCCYVVIENNDIVKIKVYKDPYYSVPEA